MDIGMLVWNRTWRLAVLAAVCATAVFAATPPAEGASFVVNSAQDGPPDGCTTAVLGCTFREAIMAANDSSAADVITFADGVTGLVPGTPLPLIEDDVTIDGGGDVGLGGFGAQTGSGLFFYSPQGQTLNDVTVRGLSVYAWLDDAIRVCPGYNPPDCLYDADGVTIENVTISESGSGVRITGADIFNVTVDDLDVSLTSAAGLRVTGANVSDVSIGQARANGNEGEGVWIAAANALTGVQILDSVASTNDLIGFRVEGATIADLDMQRVQSYTNEHGAAIGATEASGISVSDSEFRDSVFPGQGFILNAGELSDITLSRLDVHRNYIGFAIGAVTASDIEISDSEVLNSSINGISVDAESLDSMTIERNVVVGESEGIGIVLTANAGTNNAVIGNTVQTHGAGMALMSAPGESPTVTFSRNSVFGNASLGLDLFTAFPYGTVTPNDAGDADAGPNDFLNFPVLNGVAADSVVGTACANCLVELFLSDADPSGYGEGQQFLRDATANGAGAFSVPICGTNLLAGARVTATATDPAGNTSEFSFNYTLPNPSGACPTATPTPSGSPTPTITQSPTPTTTTSPVVRTQGNLDCDVAGVTLRDALFPLLYKLNLPLLSRTQPCPSLDNVIGDFRFADVNCDGVIDELDTVAILAYLADVPIPPESGCGNIGDPI